MSTEARAHGEPAISALVSGIVSDAQRLIKQQFALFRLEVKGELRQAKAAAIFMAAGALVTAGATILLVTTLVHLLNAYTAIPLWGCYGIIGGVLVGAGGIFIYLAIRQIAEVHPGLPQTTEAIKENIP